jgi:hypothetical protein
MTYLRPQQTFVATCPEDYDTFTAYVNDSDRAIGRKARVNVWFRPRTGLPAVPLNEEEVGRHSLDKFTTDRRTDENAWISWICLGLH